MTGMGGGRSDFGRGGGSSFTLVKFEREIFPFLQSTQWVPLTASNERTRIAGGYDVVFAYGLAERIRRIARRFPEGNAVGVLYGRGCECPWTRRLWIRVEGFQLAETPTRRSVLRRNLLERNAPLPPARSLDERLAELLDTPPPTGTSVVGLIHSRLGTVIALSAEEGALHARALPEPWQLSLVLSRGAKEKTVGVFGRDEDGRLRGGLLRPFYELEPPGWWRFRREVRASNYRIVERAEDLPGASYALAELRRRKVPALASAACIVFGVAGGLVLSYELSRASQPGGLLSGESQFASPIELEPAGTPDPMRALIDVFQSNVEHFDAVRQSPRDAATYCDDLADAHDAVQASFVNLIRKRDELDAESVTETVEMAIQTKGRADSRFAETGCRRRR